MIVLQEEQREAQAKVPGMRRKRTKYAEAFAAAEGCNDTKAATTAKKKFNSTNKALDAALTVIESTTDMMDNMDSLQGSMRLEAARKLYIKVIEDMQRDMTGFKDTNDEILT